MDGDYFQMVWQPVTHYVKAEWAEGWQATLSQAEKDVLGNSQFTGSRLACVQRSGQVCYKAMRCPKREVISINVFPKGVKKL